MEGQSSGTNVPIQDHQLNDEGICTSCELTCSELEIVTCRICDKRFHAVCSTASAEDKWATKTMINLFKGSSTKRNFSFFCNVCETDFETNKADVHGTRVRNLEKNMELLGAEMKKIVKLLTKEEVSDSSIPPRFRKSDRSPNLWNDEARLATVKAKPEESILTISKAIDANTDKTNRDLVEAIVVEDKIAVTKSFADKDGNYHLVCHNVATRDALKETVSLNHENIELKTPREKRPAISIVGLTKNYENHNEVVQLLVQQNTFLRQFAAGNNINDHVSVFAVKPIRNKEGVYQAFARVSQVVRQGLRTHKDKVTIGFSTCKVYDQYHVKRCNKCQQFGHYYKNCPDTNAQVCAKCSGNHSTRDCNSDNIKCVNCVKAEVPNEQCNHRADDQKCPSLCKIQEKMKKSYHLN